MTSRSEDPEQVEIVLQKILEVGLINEIETDYKMDEDIMAILTINIDKHRTKELERWVLLGIIPYTNRRFRSVERKDIFDIRATHLPEQSVH